MRFGAILGIAIAVLASSHAESAERKVPDWLSLGLEKALVDDQEGVSAAAVLLAAGFSEDVPDGERATIADKLLQLLTVPDDLVRQASGRVLSSMARSKHDSSIVGRLLPLLADPDELSRAAAAETFSMIVPDGRDEAIIDRLLSLLADPSPEVRWSATEAVAAWAQGERVAVAIDRLLALLADKNASVRWSAVEAIVRLPLGDRTDPVVDGIRKLLADEDGTVRKVAVTALGAKKLNMRAAELVDALIPLLADADSDIAKATAQTLAAISSRGNIAAVVDKLLPLLSDGRGDTPQSIGRALSSLAEGERLDGVVDTLLPRLTEADDTVRWAAAQALGAISPGDRSADVVASLLPLLNDPNRSVRQTAAQVLGARADAQFAGLVIDRLVPLLADRDASVRQATAQALAGIPPAGRSKRIVDRLLPLLTDPSTDARAMAALALAVLADGERAGLVIDRLLPCLSDPAPAVRRRAAQALAALGNGDQAADVVDGLLPLLADPDATVRGVAAQSLGSMSLGGRADIVINQLLPLLSDWNGGVRKAAADALGSVPLGAQVDAAIDGLLTLLVDPDSDVKLATIRTLTVIAPSRRAADIIDGVLPLFAHPEKDVRDAAFNAVRAMGPGGVSTAAAAVKLINSRAVADTGILRAAAHVATGGGSREDRTEVILAWLGRPAALPTGTVADDPARAERVLALFLAEWPTLSTLTSARREAEESIMTIVGAACPSRESTDTNSIAGLADTTLAWIRDLPSKGLEQTCWTSEQRPTIEQLHRRFQEAHSTHERSLAEQLKSENLVPIVKWMAGPLAGWAVFWAVFLLMFPRSRLVQAVFFWNPRVRAIMSAGFVPLLLMLVPFLRRGLLAPFREEMIASAQPGAFNRLGFFDEVQARTSDGRSVGLSEAIGRVHGVVVIRGEAGLGKTSALRWYALDCKRPVAFLHARDCAEGVDIAIGRMIQNVQEAGFIRSLVYTRALVVVIDGLNEVSADTREKISAFARDLSKGDIVIGTQPIEWKPPVGAHVIQLMPLDRERARRFLLSRPSGADASQKRHGTAYAAAVEAFFTSALDDAQTQDERRAAEFVLSNPFDLALAADLLAQGTTPQPAALIDAAFRLVDEGTTEHPGYRSITGQPFPVARFGIHAVAMRLEDRNWFKRDEFSAEIPSLLHWKLVVPRTVKGTDGYVERTQFRHDRVWDFFIVAAFAGSRDFWLPHIADPRFRGAYLRIAETWELGAAKQLLEELCSKAAETGDHATCDEFVRRLDARRRRDAEARGRRSEFSSMTAAS